MFKRDQITREAVVERLPDGDLTIAKDAQGQKAWGGIRQARPRAVFPHPGGC